MANVATLDIDGKSYRVETDPADDTRIWRIADWERHGYTLVPQEQWAELNALLEGVNHG